MQVNPTDSSSSSSTVRDDSAGRALLHISRTRSSATLHESAQQPAVTPASHTGSFGAQAEITRAGESGQSQISGTQLENMQQWEHALHTAGGEAAVVQHLTDQFQDALTPLRWTGRGGELAQVRQNFLDIGRQGQYIPPEVAAEALSNAVNQSLDIFESQRGQNALVALHFAKQLLDASFQVGGRLPLDRRNQLRERLQDLRPRNQEHVTLLHALKTHLILRGTPREDDPRPALAQHLAHLDEHLEVVLQGAFDEEFSAHWAGACLRLPLVDVDKQQEVVDQMADQLLQEKHTDDLREPLLASLTSLLQTASKLADTKCRVLVLEAAQEVLHESDLKDPAALVPMLVALAIKPLGSAPLPAQGGQELLTRGSNAARSLLERTFDHLKTANDPALLDDPCFLRYMAAMESLVDRDATALHPTLRNRIEGGHGQDTKVAFARLATKALHQLLREPQAFMQHATSLLDALEAHLQAAPEVTPDIAHEHPTAKLFGELAALGEAARGTFGDDRLAQAEQRLNALRERTLPNLPPTTA